MDTMSWIEWLKQLQPTQSERRTQMNTKIQGKRWVEMIAIRDDVLAVALGKASQEIDTKVYRMFGSLTKERAEGVVIGLNCAIREMISTD